MFGYKPAEIRKFLVALAAFFTVVVAVVLEAFTGFYGDGRIETGEWLTLALTAINAVGVFVARNETVQPAPGHVITD